MAGTGCTQKEKRQTMTINLFGWNEQRAAQFEGFSADGLVPGRVVAEHRTHYRVATNAGELSAEISTRHRTNAQERSDLPGVGDFVAIRFAPDDGPAMIEAVLERSSAIVRKASSEKRPQLIAANVDFLLIVMALDGDFNLERLERYLALARESGAVPVIVANKADLAEAATAQTASIAGIAPGVPVHVISARNRTGVIDLECYFEGNATVALVGSSGAGKSTLTNELLGRDAQLTGEVRAHDSRGRHTTTHRQLFLREHGGAIIDTPGMRGLELWNPTTEADDDFGDIEALAGQCKFRDCRHDREPKCAVRAAISNGTLSEERLAKFAKSPSRG